MTKIFIRFVLRYLALACLVALAACQQIAPRQAAIESAATRETAATGQSDRQAIGSNAQAAQQTAADNAAPAITFHLAQIRPAQGLVQVRVNPSTSLYAVSLPVFTQADLQQVVPIQAKSGQVFLRFDFNPQGEAKLARVTREAVGHYLILSVRGKLVAVPQISAAHEDGKFPVPVKSADEARAILQLLRQPSG
uniref:SecDF P1 head subdomain-containing protein n=1 Tax=Castellaniella defragrans TaxID=75697 RepID=UPI00333E6C80